LAVGHWPFQASLEAWFSSVVNIPDLLSDASPRWQIFLQIVLVPFAILFGWIVFNTRRTMNWLARLDHRGGRSVKPLYPWPTSLSGFGFIELIAPLFSRGSL
jgi:hypothetical protein